MAFRGILRAETRVSITLPHQCQAKFFIERIKPQDAGDAVVPTDRDIGAIHHTRALPILREKYCVGRVLERFVEINNRKIAITNKFNKAASYRVAYTPTQH